MEYIPRIIQVIPNENYEVYLYFDDGSIKLFKAGDLPQKGVFQILQDPKFFRERCTVLNNTLAWDLTGHYDESDCLDLDPIVLYKTCPDTEEPRWLFHESK